MSSSTSQVASLTGSPDTAAGASVVVALGSGNSANTPCQPSKGEAGAAAWAWEGPSEAVAMSSPCTVSPQPTGTSDADTPRA